MTTKKFWEILEKAGYDKKIYGYEGLLNAIACYEWHEAMNYEREGNATLQRIHEERATMIHDSLEDWNEDFYK